MSCSEVYCYMMWEGYILEEVAVAGPSSVLSLAVDHFEKGHSDHTGTVSQHRRQQE